MKTGSAQLLWGAAATAAFPAVFLKALTSARVRPTIRERLCGGDWMDGTAAPLWLHAASMGEVEGLAPVARLLGEQHEQNLLITTTSTTGREAVLKKGLSSRVGLLPYDHPLILERIIARVRPKLMIVFETEFWPNLFLSLGRFEVPLVIVNGRISDYSLSHYRRLRWLLAPALRAVRKCFVQSGRDRERFAKLGLPEVAIEVVGSTKYDQEREVFAEAELHEFRRALGLNEGPCAVAGSVRPGELELVIAAYQQALADCPTLQLVVAPRHSERFEEAALLLRQRGIRFNRRSLGAVTEPRPVMLLDTLGELRHVYAAGDFAVVGGTLVDIGGHNPYEPAMYGKPVIVGPFTSNIDDALAQLRISGGVSEVVSYDDLAASFLQYANVPALRFRAGQGAAQAWEKNRGATKRVVQEIRSYVQA